MNFRETRALSSGDHSHNAPGGKVSFRLGAPVPVEPFFEGFFTFSQRSRFSFHNKFSQATSLGFAVFNLVAARGLAFQGLPMVRTPPGTQEPGRPLEGHDLTKKWLDRDNLGQHQKVVAPHSYEESQGIGGEV